MVPVNIGMVAGESSGDQLAASVLGGFAHHGRLVDARGIGGAAMIAEGFTPWWGIEALSVSGYADVLRALPRLKRMLDELRHRLLQWQPDLFVGVDNPDFNLRVEPVLRAQGIKVAHFISPSIWAWRRERISIIRSAVDHMLLVFPFEQAIYDAEGIPATYVGHPMADAIPLQTDPAAARQRLGLPEGREVVALLPGSRVSEIEHLAELFLRTAGWLADRRRDLSFVLPAANASLYQRLRAMIGAHPLARRLDLLLLQGQARDALEAADTALIASGTATLEAALYRKPMVIAYRVNWLNYRMMRNKGYLPWVGLPNILCNESIVPEFLQQAATPEAIGKALLAQLDAPAERARIAERFAQLHHSLRMGCAERSTQVLLEMIDGR